MKVGFGVGLLIGLLLAAPLVSIQYLLHATVATPLTSFDLFDGLVRILPGSVISFGIDSMVRLLMLLGLSLSASSKTAEQIQAIAIFVCACTIASGIFFCLLKDKGYRAIALPGVVLGVATALPMTLLSGSGVWTTITLIAWGMAVSGVRYRLVGLSPRAAVSSASPSPQLLHAVDRRRFLINLSGATASITVVGAAVAAVLRTSTSEPVVLATSDVELPHRPDAIEPAPGQNTRQLRTITASTSTSGP